MSEAIIEGAPKTIVTEYDESFKKPIEVQKISDIPIVDGTFYFHSGHTLDLQENAPKILAGDASTVYKVTNEHGEKHGEPIAIEKDVYATVIDMNKLIKPILIYRSKDINPFLNAIFQQLGTDRQVATTSAWKINMLSEIQKNPATYQLDYDKLIEEEKERLARTRKVMLNNYKSTQSLIDKLESFKFQYDGCKEMIRQLKDVLAAEQNDLDENNKALSPIDKELIKEYKQQ